MAVEQPLAASVDELMLAALERGGDTTRTGRYLMTFKEGAVDAGIRSLTAKKGLRIASARDFEDQAVDLAAAGDAHAVVFPEIGVALVAAGLPKGWTQRRTARPSCDLRQKDSSTKSSPIRGRKLIRYSEACSGH